MLTRQLIKCFARPQMFKAKSDPDDKPKRERDPMSSDIQIGGTMTNSVICRRITIVGNAYSEGDVQIEGTFQGDVQSATLMIGAIAQVEGTFKAKEITVCGQVEGTIIGGRVVLQKDSYVEGDIYHESLSIEDGAIFKGKSYQAKYDGTGTGSSTGAIADKGAGADTKSIAEDGAGAGSAKKDAVLPTNRLADKLKAADSFQLDEVR